MNKKTKLKFGIVACAVAISGMALAQFKLGDLLKIGGVTLLVSKFGGQINGEINKIAHTPDSNGSYSKVVPILSGGINGRKAIGAAQVRGTRTQVNKVNAVAMIDQDFIGVRLKVMIPISSKNVIQNLKPVPGVGVTGIVDTGFNL